MREINFPSGVVSSHGAVVDLVRGCLKPGLAVRLRAVGVKDTNGVWKSAFGRFDLAKQADLRPGDVHPKDKVILVDEVLSGDGFLAKLEPALRGEPLRVGGVDLRNHGMEGGWEAYQHTDDWRDYGTQWPCIVAAPQVQIRPRPHVREPIEADGQVFDGLDQLLDHISDMIPTPGHRGRDVRFSQFQLLIWDYHGRIDRCEIDGTSVRIAVSPPNASGLRLVGIAAGASVRRSDRPGCADDSTNRAWRTRQQGQLGAELGEEVVAEAKIGIGTRKPSFGCYKGSLRQPRVRNRQRFLRHQRASPLPAQRVEDVQNPDDVLPFRKLGGASPVEAIAGVLGDARLLRSSLRVCRYSSHADQSWWRQAAA